MQPAFVVRLRPIGPWRFGPDSGARDRVDLICHSDTLFSAVTHAMEQLGRLEEWLAATVNERQGPAVRFSSLFPFLEEVHFITPPQTMWPRPPSPRVRWNAARFIPLSLVSDLLEDRTPAEEGWRVDCDSQCLIPTDIRFSAPAPFRIAFRSHAAVDRCSPGNVHVHRAACLEFADGGGFWGVVVFADEEAWSAWSEPVRAAFRLLADTGLGGGRSLGWGRSEQPEFIDGEMPGLVIAAALPQPPANGEPASESAWWLLSVFVPAAEDDVDWSRGSYSLLTRGGRVESRQRWGEPKKLLRVVAEGSVLHARAPLRGAARNVAPDGVPHPVFRSGLALAVPVPVRAERSLSVL